MSKILAGYIRVSTEMQVDRDSLINQEERIKIFAQSKGKEYRIYKDAGVSAVNPSRPMFNQMINDIKVGLIDTVVVTKLDRIIRSLKDLINLLEIFQKHNVTLISLTETLDISTAFGRFGLQLLGAVAELERGITSERVASDMKARALRKKWNGGVIPYGFKWIPEKKTLEVNEKEADVVRKIFDTYLQLKTLRGVVHYLNSSGFRTRNGSHWSWTTVGRILSNPMYYGALTYNKRFSSGKTSKPRPINEHIIIDDVFKPIISKQIFQQVQAIRKEQSKIPARIKNTPYLLTGLLKCNDCSSKMHGYTYYDKRKHGRVYKYYKCSGHLQKGSSFCKGNTIRVEELENLIIHELKNLVLNTSKLKENIEDFEKDFINEIKPLEKRFKFLQSRLREIERRVSKTFELYEDNIITKDEFVRRKSQIEESKKILEKEILEIETMLNEKPQIDFSNTLNNIKNLADIYQELDFNERKELLRTVISEIRVSKHEVEYDIFALPEIIGSQLHGCPCGYFSDPNKQCTCTIHMIKKYRTKISGPLMDRIDVHIEVPSIKYESLAKKEAGEPSEQIRARVNKARAIQLERFKDLKRRKPIYNNSQMEAKEIKKFCEIDSISEGILKNAIDRVGFSARAYDRILKVARTIADLEGSVNIKPNHISEAIHYRTFDRSLV